LQLTFSGGLNVDSAVDVKHYLVKVNDVAVAIESASYSASTQSVTLDLPPGALSMGDSVAAAWDNLLDTRGKPLTGQTGLLIVR
jgi:hypothetical protein